MYPRTESPTLLCWKLRVTRELRVRISGVKGTDFGPKQANVPKVKERRLPVKQALPDDLDAGLRAEEDGCVRQAQIAEHEIGVVPGATVSAACCEVSVVLCVDRPWHGACRMSPAGPLHVACRMWPVASCTSHDALHAACCPLHLAPRTLHVARCMLSVTSRTSHAA